MKKTFKNWLYLAAMLLTTNMAMAQELILEFRNGHFEDVAKTIYVFDLWVLRGNGYDVANPVNSDWQFMNIRADVQVPSGVRLFRGTTIVPNEIEGAVFTSTAADLMYSGGGQGVSAVPGSGPAGTSEFGINIVRTSQLEVPDVTGVRLGQVKLYFTGSQVSTNTITVRPTDGSTFTAFWTNLDSNIPRKIFVGPVGLPLPVTLQSFNVAKEGKTAMISWSTSQEVNSDRFDLERSHNGKNWEVLKTVQALGESQLLHEYSEIDESPLNGENLYRLHMVDKDGSNTYSKIQRLKFDNKLKLTLYPNPTTDLLTIKGEEWEMVSGISVYNSAGLEVYKSGLFPESEINLGKLAAGIYTVKITEKNSTTNSYRIVVAK